MEEAGVLAAVRAVVEVPTNGADVGAVVKLTVDELVDGPSEPAVGTGEHGRETRRRRRLFPGMPDGR